MTKQASAKYYQKTNKTFLKSLAEGIKIFLVKRKIKTENMVVNVVRISQKMKNKSYLSIE